MKKTLFTLFLLVPILLSAQAPPPESTQEAAIGALMFIENQVVSLAEAIPADKYDWRPADGVRSIGESIMHMAAANYFIPMTAGHTPPEGVDIMTLESSVTEKDDIIAALKASYTYAREGIEKMSDKELKDKVEFPFPGEYNKLSAIMIVTGHCSEHKGQLIAYARMNGITPPWSE